MGVTPLSEAGILDTARPRRQGEGLGWASAIRGTERGPLMNVLEIFNFEV